MKNNTFSNNIADIGSTLRIIGGYQLKFKELFQKEFFYNQRNPNKYVEIIKSYNNTEMLLEQNYLGVSMNLYHNEKISDSQNIEFELCPSGTFIKKNNKY